MVCNGLVEWIFLRRSRSCGLDDTGIWSLSLDGVCDTEVSRIGCGVERLGGVV